MIGIYVIKLKELRIPREFTGTVLLSHLVKLSLTG